MCEGSAGFAPTVVRLTCGKVRRLPSNNRSCFGRFAATLFSVLSVITIFWLGADTALAVDKPDLVPELRSAPYQGQVAPVYVDAYEQPGELLYRFDAIIRNRGGTLDLFRDPDTGSAMQAVWRGGEPSEAPDPNRQPSSSDAALIDIGARGARFGYVFERTHDHWHFFTAGRYLLELPGGSERVSEKVGFCLFDGFGGEASGRWFRPDYTGSGTQTWCGFGHPQGAFVRMGLSSEAADRYASQREFQWIDISGLRPGRYTVLAQVNPYGHIEEAEDTNNVVRESRLIPGVVAAEVLQERSRDEGVTVELSASVVAPEIPARKSASCEPTAASGDCYVSASPSGPLTFRIDQQPTHGSVSLTNQRETTATARYDPAPGYAGEDSFTYTATDGRGLTSPPARVRMVLRPAQPSHPSDDGAQLGRTPSARPIVPSPRRILTSLKVRRQRGRWYAVLRLGKDSFVRGRLDRRRGSGYVLDRRLERRRLTPGRRRLPLGRLNRGGRYRVGVEVVSDGQRELVERRFRAAR